MRQLLADQGPSAIAEREAPGQILAPPRPKPNGNRLPNGQDKMGKFSRAAPDRLKQDRLADAQALATSAQRPPDAAVTRPPTILTQSVKGSVGR